MNKKQTSPSIASTASKILKDNRFSEKAKSVAGSALSQTKSTGNTSKSNTSKKK